MSTCISRHGEYSSHHIDADYICTRCGVLDVVALVAELNRLRANQLPDGVETLTWYGHVHAGELCSAGREADTHQRRVWLGPVEPIESVGVAEG